MLEFLIGIVTGYQHTPDPDVYENEYSNSEPHCLFWEDRTEGETAPPVYDQADIVENEHEQDYDDVLPGVLVETLVVTSVEVEILVGSQKFGLGFGTGLGT